MALSGWPPWSIAVARRDLARAEVGTGSRLRDQCPRLASRRPGGGPASLGSGAPSSPPVRVCGNKAILGGGPHPLPRERSSSRRAITVAPLSRTTGPSSPDTTYWFAPGMHTLGTGQFSQIIPANGDTFIGAPGAILDGQHSNLYAFTQPARNVTIRYLTIQNFGARGDNSGQGVVNHDQGSGWHIDHVTVQDSAGAGVMLGSGNVLAYSCLKDNGEYGFQGGGSHITVDHNEIVGNNTDNWEARQPGCGCTGGAKFWGVNGATITSNYVHDNHGAGPVGGHQQPGLRRRAQLHRQQPGRGIHLRDQLQPAAGAQHLRPQRPGRRAAPGRVPRFRGLHLRVRRRQSGPGAIREQLSRSPATRSSTTGVEWSCGRTPTGTAARRPTPRPATALWSTRKW